MYHYVNFLGFVFVYFADYRIFAENNLNTIRK